MNIIESGHWTLIVSIQFQPQETTSYQGKMYKVYILSEKM